MRRLTAALLRTLSGAAAACAFMATAFAAYPERTINMVVPFAAGGTTDIIARIVAEHMSRTLGQQIVVENVTGAGGTVGVLRVSKAAPDGYQLLMGNLGTQAASVGLYPSLAYDPRRDFEPIINTGGTPMLVAARKDLPVKDFREFVAYVKANGPKLNYGTGGVGATSHLTCLFLSSLLDASPLHVPFRGSGPALNALIAGQVDYVCDQTVLMVPQIQAGTVKGIVAAVPKRVAVIPDVPTSAEQGLPAFQVTGWNAMFAPKGTPKDIVDKLNESARAALNDAGIRKRLAELGLELPTAAEATPAALGELVRVEIDKWVPIIRKAGVKVD
jgi:tripartite-type tricarboxylate transporter receptor subunit TctC